jgi:GTP-binding protein
MKPVIALVGRPNVGKSTLFNRLTASRDALVSDFPGLTRDRQYGRGRLGGRPYIVVDTGGLSGEREGIDVLMAAQAMRAVEEADLVLFLVDGRAGLTAADETILQRLRTTGKTLALAINKTEGADPSFAAGEFARLGVADVYCISSAHGEGVASMMSEALARFPQDEDSAAQEAEGVRIALIGRPNVGKSTLVNRILGEERMLTFDMPGTTRDSIFVPFERDGRAYTLIDTAGVRRRARVHEAIEKFSIVKTLQAMEAAHVVLLVLDARQGIGEQDARLLGHAVESGRALVIAINKWDGLSSDERVVIKTALDRRLSFVDYAEVHYISALHGSGVGDLFTSIDSAYEAGNCSLSTPMLTRLLQRAIEHHAPPLVHGRRIKLRYAHQGGQNPPVIIIHGSQTHAVSDSYRRYLEGVFRGALDLAGTPVRIEFRTGDNPYRPRKPGAASVDGASKRRPVKARSAAVKSGAPKKSTAKKSAPQQSASKKSAPRKSAPKKSARTPAKPAARRSPPRAGRAQASRSRGRQR